MFSNFFRDKPAFHDNVEKCVIARQATYRGIKDVIGVNLGSITFLCSYLALRLGGGG
jgi:hypothetical protein